IPGVIFNSVAFCEVQRKVVVCPRCMVAGSAVSVTVGAFPAVGVGACGGCGGGTFFLQAPEISTRSIRPIARLCNFSLFSFKISSLSPELRLVRWGIHYLLDHTGSEFSP